MTISNLVKVIKAKRRPRCKPFYVIIKSRFCSWPHIHYMKKKHSVSLSFLNIIIYLGGKKICKKWTVQDRIYWNTKLGHTNIKCYKHINEGYKWELVYCNKSIEVRLAPLYKIWLNFRKVEEIIVNIHVSPRIFLPGICFLDHYIILSHSQNYPLLSIFYPPTWHK